MGGEWQSTGGDKWMAVSSKAERLK